MVHLPGGLNVNVGLLNYAKWIREVGALSSRVWCRLVDTPRTDRMLFLLSALRKLILLRRNASGRATLSGTR